MRRAEDLKATFDLVQEDSTVVLFSFYDERYRLVSASRSFHEFYDNGSGRPKTLWKVYADFLNPEDARRKGAVQFAAPIQLELGILNGVERKIVLLPSSPGTAVVEIRRQLSGANPRDDRAALLHLATHDALTGLSNRREFASRLANALEHRSEGMVALLQLDLDDFKPVNDTLGHGAGDIVLIGAANRIRSALGDGESAYRLAGDEFAVLKENCATFAEGERLAERLVQKFKSPIDANGITLFVGASVGVAFAPDDGGDSEALMKAADVALYAAKQNGRGQYSMFDQSMLHVLEQREVLRRSLKRALHHDEMYVEYQPQTDSQGIVTGFEALLRWRHPLLGQVAPSTFIPMAEADGLMPEIGNWVLETACREASRWPGGISLAVNVSAAEFLTPGLTDRISETLDRTGLSPDRLELEVTESVLLERTINNLDTLNTLNVLGIRIALDDFGTEYSSLTYLKNFPFDSIKVDRGFVSDLQTNAKSATIVDLVIRLAHGLGMRAIAEGVETPEQAAWLWQHECDLIQGYLVSRPMSAEAVAVFLQTAMETGVLNIDG